MDWIIALAARWIVAVDDLAEAEPLLDALHGSGAAVAFLDLARLIGEVGDPDGLIGELDDEDQSDPLVAIGSLVAACFAAVRADYPSQREAVAARARLSGQANAAYAVIGSAFGADALAFTVRIAGEAIVQLSRHPANMTPLITVESAISMPSSWLAWRLYGDPSRGGELVQRNRSGTPLMMPATIEALAV